MFTFEFAPFRIDPTIIQDVLDRIAEDPNAKDIRVTVTSAGTVYLYSSTILKMQWRISSRKKWIRATLKCSSKDPAGRLERTADIRVQNTMLTKITTLTLSCLAAIDFSAACAAEVLTTLIKSTSPKNLSSSFLSVSLRMPSRI